MKKPTIKSVQYFMKRQLSGLYKIYRVTITEFNGRTISTKKLLARDLTASDADNYIYIQSLNV
jgi:hypothetical protein